MYVCNCCTPTHSHLLHAHIQTCMCVYVRMCTLPEYAFSLIHTRRPPIHPASSLMLQRSFVASTPTHSSTPIGLAPPTAGLVRHKSIMEEIQDTNVGGAEGGATVGGVEGEGEGLLWVGWRGRGRGCCGRVS